MKQNTKKMSTHELLPIAEELIKAGKPVQIKVSGNSMRPFIAGNRDKVVLGAVKKLKKGDVVLYKNSYGEYLLHRICSIKDTKCKTIGDYCLHKDNEIDQADIIAVAKLLIRKGKKIPCDSLIWQLYSKLWLALLPVRSYLLTVHKLYQKTKKQIRQGVGFIVLGALSRAGNMKESLRRGWLSQDD